MKKLGRLTRANLVYTILNKNNGEIFDGSDNSILGISAVSR